LRSIPNVREALERSSLLRPYHLQKTAKWLLATAPLSIAARNNQLNFQIERAAPRPTRFDQLLRLCTSLTWHDILLGAIEQNDHNIFRTFDWQTIPPNQLSLTISLCLKKNEVELVQKLLLLLSRTYNNLMPDPTTVRMLGLIASTQTALTMQAAASGRYDVFQELLRWGIPNDPHPQRQLVNPNSLLYKLASVNFLRAVEILLNSYEVDTQYRPEPFEVSERAFGIQAALLIAATRDHVDVLETIFRLKPGNQIDRRILSYIIAGISRLLVRRDGEINLVARRIVDRFQQERRNRYPDQEGTDDNLGLLEDDPAAPAPAPDMIPPFRIR
jgi:hypothetical protein